MKIPFILNNENIVVDTNPDTVLSKVLRENSIFSAKNGSNASSPAALLVKVMAKILYGLTPNLSMRYAILWVITLVLPEPAPAKISKGPSV